MRRLIVATALLVLLAACFEASAQAPNRVAGRGVQRAATHAGHHHHHGTHGGRQRGITWWFDGGLPWLGCPTYTPVFEPYLPSFSYFGYTYTLPVAVPVAPAVPAAPVAAAMPVAPAPVDPPDPADPPGVPKKTGGELKARAGRFLGIGDRVFATQRYLAALERYKTAVEVAPDMAEAYMRQAFVQVALGHYDKAAQAFRRGLRLRGDWRGAALRLDQLYDGALPKNAHLEALAAAVQANPFDADLLMVLGLQLYFDGQPQRAEAFLLRAAQLGANEEGLLDAFLPQADPADPAAGKDKVAF